MVDFINPNQQQLSNWDVGDVIESFSGFGIYYSGGTFQLLDTVIDKVISGDFANYTISGSTFTCSPCSPICRPGGYSFSDLVYPLLDTAQMPEDDFYSDRNYLFYYPKDSSYCSLSPAYTAVLPHYTTGGLGGVWEQAKYKLGIGKTFYQYEDGEPTYENDDLLYCNFHGISCGTPLSVNNIKPAHKSILYPNPATTEITITAPDKITSVSIINLLGQTVYSQSFNKEQVQVNVSDLPSGLYFVKINDADFRKFVKE